MPKSIINIADVELTPRSAQFSPSGARAELYDLKMSRIAPSLGAQKLGYNITVVAPGKRAFPFHSHRVNEEMFFILSGNGEVRIGSETYALRTGDILACPAGGPETAHQIINSGAEELRYLAVSTRLEPEVCEYPDSSKFGVYAEFVHAGSADKAMFRHIGRETQALDYWEGE